MKISLLLLAVLCSSSNHAVTAAMVMTQSQAQSQGSGNSSILPQTAVVVDPDILKVRQFVAAEYAAAPQLYDPDDIDDIMTGPTRFVTRYFDWFGRGNMATIKAQLKSNLQWRNQYGLDDLQASDFPCEFWLAGPMHYTTDRQGRPAVIVDVRTQGVYSGGLRDSWYQMMYWAMNWADELAGELPPAPGSVGGRPDWKLLVSLVYTIIENVSDVQGLAVFFPLADRFAGRLNSIQISDIHPVVETMVRMLVGLTSPRTRELISFLNEQEKFLIIKNKDLPSFIGGKLPLEKSLMVQQFPGTLQECAPLRTVAKERGWSEASVDQFLAMTQPFINTYSKVLGY